MKALKPRILKTPGRACLAVLLCCTALTGLSGCGQKGALYLPAPATPSAPAAPTP
jgi:predicted small lipoprotein YifL